MTFNGTLLPYQEEAVELMCKRKHVLVAYDLGLGKTVLTIAALEQLRDAGKITLPGLVICLSSLKYQWASQIKKFSDAKPLVIDGSKAQRQAQYADANNYDYIIMNYEQVVNDWEFIPKLPRGFVVIDEATAIKSFRSKRSKYVKKLRSPYNFALTGTPVENGKAEELFSIMQFVDPYVFGQFPKFDQDYIVRNHFGGVQRYKNISHLNQKLSAACVRKRQSDDDVSPYLPTTIMAEPIIVPFDSSSSKLYHIVANDLLNDLDEAVELLGEGVNLFGPYVQDEELNSIRGRIMPKLMVMRQLCSHPELIKQSADLYQSSIESTRGSAYASELLDAGALPKVIRSPKLDVLKETVDSFLDSNPDNKLVIFTSFVRMTEILVKEFEKYKPQIYNGTMNAKEKEDSKVRFQTDKASRIIVSSDAGGYGVDLPQANMLINYDLPWSAGLALQRNGRIQRASSEWERVVIQDILMENSIEERQFEMLRQKMSVANAIIDGEGLDEDGGLALTLGSLRQFLREISQ